MNLFLKQIPFKPKKMQKYKKNEISQEKIIYDGLEQKIKESEDLKEIINTRRTGLEGCIEKLNKKFDNTEDNV